MGIGVRTAPLPWMLSSGHKKSILGLVQTPQKHVDSICISISLSFPARYHDDDDDHAEWIRHHHPFLSNTSTTIRTCIHWPHPALMIVGMRGRAVLLQFPEVPDNQKARFNREGKPMF